MWVLRFHKIQGLGEEQHCRKVGRKQLREGLTGSECRYMSKLPAVMQDFSVDWEPGPQHVMQVLGEGPEWSL